MLERVRANLNILPREILHVAESLHHDHVPANDIGLSNAWIHRRHAKSGHGATRAPETDCNFLFTFNSLADLVDQHRREQA